MWLRNALLICCTIAAVLGEDDIITEARPGQEFVQIQSSIGDAAPVQARAIPIEEFVTSHKIPEGIIKPSDDDSVEAEQDVKIAEQVIEQVENLEKQVEGLEQNEKKVEEVKVVEQSLDPAEEDSLVDKTNSKRQARVELESFSDAGVLPEQGLRKSDIVRLTNKSEKDAIIPGVEVSAENPTTMVPILTTTRESQSFDFVPVNIIREDSKDAYTPYSDRHFGDLSDVSLVPAGTNSRIQVKKGPNGKDYEYEYVYYYYDEEDEGKAGSATNSHDGPARSTPAPRRGASGNRSKYSSIERTTTAEPTSNEVLPSRNSNRGRQLADGEEVSEERLPANTRFPPRSRSNHNTGTTEPTRPRGNRPRPSLDLVDSSSFRTHQEGPEFPQNLPKGPVRFLGVTPNENTEEKPATRVRGRPQKLQEPAPVEEAVDEPVRPQRKRPAAADAVEPEVEIEFSKGQPIRPSEDDESSEPDAPASAQETDTAKEQPKNEIEKNPAEDQNVSEILDVTTTEIPTTENPSAMDKVALDLYAFSQQGQNNLVDTSLGDNESSGSTTVSDDESTTDLPTTTEIVITTMMEPTTTTTEPTTTTTTTTEPPTTTTQAPAGRGKFRRPGYGGGVGTRNRFKSNGASTTTTEAPAEPTQKPRGRFGATNGGYKRQRPGQKHHVEEEEIQKDTASSVNAEKPTAPARNRFRGASSRTSPSSPSTTASPSTPSISSSSGSSVSRPSFNRLNLNRRRGRPTSTAATTTENNEESGETGQTDSQADNQDTSTTAKPSIKPRLPGSRPRPLRPGPRINLRLRPGQATSTSAAPETSEHSVEEPAGAGTEEETHEAPAESSPETPSTTANPLNKLRTRNRLQVQPKAPVRAPVPAAPRRSPLLPKRRTTTEAPVEEASSEEPSSEGSEETEPTETTLPETSTAASTKHEEARGLSSLLAPRRRIAPRRPGQIVSRE